MIIPYEIYRYRIEKKIVPLKKIKKKLSIEEIKERKTKNNEPFGRDEGIGNIEEINNKIDELKNFFRQENEPLSSEENFHFSSVFLKEKISIENFNKIKNLENVSRINFGDLEIIVGKIKHYEIYIFAGGSKNTLKYAEEIFFGLKEAELEGRKWKEIINIYEELLNKKSIQKLWYIKDIMRLNRIYFPSLEEMREAYNIAKEFATKERGECGIFHVTLRRINTKAMPTLKAYLDVATNEINQQIMLALDIIVTISALFTILSFFLLLFYR